MVFVQETGASPFSLPYAIDRKPGDLTLSEITRGAIDYLFQKSNKGFFLMVEGGKIDWAGIIKIGRQWCNSGWYCWEQVNVCR